MGFVAPLALSFAALALPILIFYTLKLRREKVVVSSTMLWQQVLRDQEANSPWRRLRRNLLLLLQLLVLLLLVMALARPYSKAGRVPRIQGNVIVLLDASASMQATDVAPSRFEVARAEARQIVDQLGPRDVMTLIAVGDTARVLSSQTSERSALRQALDTVQVTNAEGDWEAALVLARMEYIRMSIAQQTMDDRQTSLHEGSDSHTFVILSDGGLTSRGGRSADLHADVLNPALPGQVRYVPIGITAENRAISALAVRDGPQGPQAFVRISNVGTQPATVLLQVYVDGALFDARSLSLASGTESGFTIDDLPLDTREVEARLDDREMSFHDGAPTAGPLAHQQGDPLAFDNTAWAVRSPSESRRVRRVPGSNGGAASHPRQSAVDAYVAYRDRTILLTTKGNTFLERALSLLPDLNPITVRVTRTLTHAVTAQPAVSPALYIFDGVSPAALPKSGNLLFIAPPTSTDLFTVAGSLTRTHISRVEYSSPLLHYVDLDNVHVARAQAVKPPLWARTLIAAEGGPLLLAGEVAGRRIAILTFDLHHSDLPLQIAFPILVSNLTRWLAPASAVDVPAAGWQGQTGESVSSLRPGAPVMLRPQADAADEIRPSELIVIAPSGQRWTYPVQGSAPIPFAQTHELGIYTVEQRSLATSASVEHGTITLAHFAVNLFSDLESHIEPKDTIAIGRSPVSGQTGDRARLTGAAERREWWRWTALAGLIVLLVEWGADKGIWQTS